MNVAGPSSPRSPLEQFLQYAEFEKGFAANTILSYRRQLGKFFAYLQGRQQDCLLLDENDVLDFIRREGARAAAPRRRPI